MKVGSKLRAGSAYPSLGRSHFEKKLNFWGLRGEGGGKDTPISKIRISFIHNGCPIAHQKFEHSGSIRKCYIIRKKVDILDSFLPFFQVS